MTTVAATSAPERPQVLLARRLCSTAMVLALFLVFVGGTLSYLRLNAATSDPWKSPQLLALKAKLVAEPANEALKTEIRQLDYDFRRQFRRRLAMDRSGSWFLIAGALLMVAVAKRAAELAAPGPVPSAKAAGSTAQIAQAHARWSVVVAGGVAAAALATFCGVVTAGLPALDAAPGKLGSTAEANAAPADIPSTAELQANWAAFRGWDGSGATVSSNAPLSWDGATGRGVAWKSALPLPGHNTPIVWGDRVFVTGATGEKREVFCYDAGGGELRWRTEITRVPGSPPEPVEVGESTGFAASTGATDGRRFYALFANGDVAAVKFDGVVAWTKSVAPIRNPFGLAASLALFRGKLLLQLDQGEASKPASKLLALDAATGRTLWETRRPVPASWATPLVVDVAGKPLVVALGEPWVIAYSLEDGAEVWRAELLQSEIVPSPIFAGGLLVAVSPTSKLLAIRADGSGDLGKAAPVWTATDNVPDVTCPVAAGGLIFTANSGGTVTCVDAADGRKAWDHDFGMEVQASPVILGDRLLVLGADGTAVQMQVGRTFRELSRSRLADRFLASPAVAAGSLYLRGETNLFCLRADNAPGGGASSHGGN